jgi:hypothetical protein
MLPSLLLVAGHRHHQVPCHHRRNAPTATVAGESRAGLSHHRQPRRQTRTTRAPARRDHERQVRPQGHQTGPSWADPARAPHRSRESAKEPPPPHKGQREQIQSPSARIRTPPGWIQLLPAGTGTAAKEEVTSTKTRTMEEGKRRGRGQSLAAAILATAQATRGRSGDGEERGRRREYRWRRAQEPPESP